MGQCCCTKLDADLLYSPEAAMAASPGAAVPLAPAADAASKEARQLQQRRRRQSTRCASIVDSELFGEIPSELSRQARKEVFLLRGMVKSGLLPLKSYVMIAAEIVDDDSKLARLVNAGGSGGGCGVASRTGFGGGGDGDGYGGTTAGPSMRS